MGNQKHDQEEYSVPSDFVIALQKRIPKIRKKTKLKSKKHKSGKLFNDDASVIESVVIAVADTAQACHSDTVAKANATDVVLISSKAVGLRYDKALIKSGSYDDLIKSVLIRLAEIDHSHESDPTFN